MSVPADAPREAARETERQETDSTDNIVSHLCSWSLLIKRTQSSQTNTHHNGAAGPHTLTLLVLTHGGLWVTQCFCAATGEPPCQGPQTGGNPRTVQDTNEKTPAAAFHQANGILYFALLSLSLSFIQTLLFPLIILFLWLGFNLFFIRINVRH